jgi:hypothetical protein
MCRFLVDGFNHSCPLTQPARGFSRLPSYARYEEKRDFPVKWTTATKLFARRVGKKFLLTLLSDLVEERNAWIVRR